jgi:hypothetical protein
MTTAPPLEGSTTASPWVPLWRIIDRIASAIGDSRELEHYARTRLRIRQAALDGRLRIRGRHEIESAGQDRTTFSDVYSEIPSSYWKHSVINALTTAAISEAGRHTNPETTFAWGPKGLHEINCYTGLQLYSDDVSALTGDERGAGFSSDTPTSENEEWISAASAIALLGMDNLPGARTICKRAHAGLIKARAERFIRDGRSADNVDVPVEFWWAEGGAALDQNWATGDFDTWIDQRIRLQAFGVTFRRSDIERSKPAPLGKNVGSPTSTLARPLGLIQETAAQEVGGTVFISYTHDGPDHSQEVLDLSNRLRSEGIDCVLDQYESSPPEGWPQWMDREIEKAQSVLMICTAAYYRRVMGKENPGIGLGIRWEGSLIYNHIYNDDSRNKKFIPIVFDAAHAIHIPTPVQGATRYNLGSPEGYAQLYDRLIGKPPAEKPPLGDRKALPHREIKTTFFNPSSTVATLTKLDRHLCEAMDYLQAMTRAYRFEGEVSEGEYCRLCNASVASARETLAEGRLFLPPDLTQQCEQFLNGLVVGLVNHANTRREDIADGHQRAAFWNVAAKIAYEELPNILKQFETASYYVIRSHERF